MSSRASRSSPFGGNKVESQFACLGESGTFTLLLLQVAVGPGQPAGFFVASEHHHFDQGRRVLRIALVAAHDRPPAHAHVLPGGEGIAGGGARMQRADLSAQGQGVEPGCGNVSGEVLAVAHALDPPAGAGAAGTLEQQGEALHA